MRGIVADDGDAFCPVSIGSPWRLSVDSSSPADGFLPLSAWEYSLATFGAVRSVGVLHLTPPAPTTPLTSEGVARLTPSPPPSPDFLAP